jgi:hypothetical protein
MSWFKRNPAPKHTPAPVVHRSSPAATRLLKETKAATKPTEPAQSKQTPTQ